MSITIRSILTHVHAPDGTALDRTTLLTRRAGCPEPRDPEEQEAERVALQVAISFAVASANARDDHVIDWHYGPIATAEVSTFLGISCSDGRKSRIALKRGGPIANRFVGGHRLDSGSLVQAAPEGLIDMPELELDGDLARATYQVEATTRGANEPCAAHKNVSAALHWYQRAWENSPLHTMPDVLFQLKTALEALSGTSRSWEGKELLESIYCDNADSAAAHMYLWHSTAARQTRVHGNKSEEVSAFAHWYMHLADLRNDIVHDTRPPDMEYSEAESPYRGNTFQVAERVTRELITIRIAQLGFPTVVLSPPQRGVLERLTALGTGDQGLPIKNRCTCHMARPGPILGE